MHTKQETDRTPQKQSLLSSLPSLLSLPPHTSLPISFTVPLTGSDAARSSYGPFGHRPASRDIKDKGQPRFGPESVVFHPSSADVESSKKMVLGGETSETCQFDMGGLHCLGSFAISLDTSPTEDARGCVHVQVSERLAKPAIHGNRQRPPSVTSWSGADPSFGMVCYASPPLSAPVSIPSPGAMDHLAVFAGTRNAHSRMSFDTQLMSSGYTAFAQHDQEQSFDYYPGIIPE